MKSSIRGSLTRLLVGACLLTFSLCGLASYTPDSVPNPRPEGTSHIANPDNIIDADHQAQIEHLLARLEADKGVQVAVVAVSDIESPSDAFDFAQALFERWRIGDRARDDGLLVLLVRDQRTVRMHTGYGLEGLLPDLLCHSIQEQFMKPAFKAGHYGEGLLLGLTEVDRLVRNPTTATQTIAALPATTDGWPVAQWFLMVPMAFIGLVLFAVRNMRGHFSIDASDPTLPPVSMRLGRVAWLTRYVVLPLGIVWLVGLMTPGHRLGLAISLLYAYWVLVATLKARRLHRCARSLFANQAHARLHQLLGQQRAFWVWMAIWMPIPFLVYLPYLLTLRRRYRRRGRPCEACGQPMRRLSEREEDAHLSDARQTEERLGSVDHDVWLCGACGSAQRVSFVNDNSDFEACPKCSTVAMSLESDTVLKSATPTRQGKGMRKHICRHCGHQRKETYLIARTDTSSSDSSASSTLPSDSSSSSSSSNWGGGSSGGGGASTSW